MARSRRTPGFSEAEVVQGSNRPTPEVGGKRRDFAEMS
jgi:hypothetical protein